MASLLAVPIAAIIALAPLIVVRYAGRGLGLIEATGAFACFTSALALGLLAGLWPVYRATYFLALFLEADAIALSWMGIFKLRWDYYYVALAAQIYLILLAAVAYTLKYPSPFII
jgi:hypothetical protein